MSVGNGDGLAGAALCVNIWLRWGAHITQKRQANPLHNNVFDGDDVEVKTFAILFIMYKNIYKWDGIYTKDGWFFA